MTKTTMTGMTVKSSLTQNDIHAAIVHLMREEEHLIEVLKKRDPGEVADEFINYFALSQLHERYDQALDSSNALEIAFEGTTTYGEEGVDDEQAE